MPDPYRPSVQAIVRAITAVTAASNRVAQGIEAIAATLAVPRVQSDYRLLGEVAEPTTGYRAVGPVVAMPTTTPVGPAPIADDATTTDDDGPLSGIEVRVPCPYCPPPAMIPRTLITDHIARIHHPGLVYPPELTTEEDTRRAAGRRESLLNLLDRIDRGVELTPEERALLRRHVHAETFEREHLATSHRELTRTLRQVDDDRQTWRGKAEETEEERDRLAAELAAIRRALDPDDGQYINEMVDGHMRLEQKVKEQQREIQTAITQRDRARVRRDDYARRLDRAIGVGRWIRRNYPGLAKVSEQLDAAVEGAPPVTAPDDAPTTADNQPKEH